MAAGRRPGYAVRFGGRARGGSNGPGGSETVDGPITIEICVADVESAIAAEAGGADRIELCDNLAVGGTTPSIGTIAEACRWLSLPVHVLIRPRAGGFVYSDRELAVMRRDIEAAKALGAAGVVLGVLDAEGRIDRERTAELVGLARPLSVTFHKAIDQARDPLESFDALIAMGVDRVLTSGGRPTALEGCAVLRSLVDRAAGRVAVMAGGRLAVDHLEAVIRDSGVREIHLGSAASRPVEGQESGSTGPDGGSPWTRTDARLVQAVVDLISGLGSGKSRSGFPA
jgi:copper homeostasis protein